MTDTDTDTDREKPEPDRVPENTRLARIEKRERENQRARGDRLGLNQ